MASYISSNDNRLYTAIESGYGKVEPVTGLSRIPAVKLKTRQQIERVQRRDKTGSRTFPGEPAGLRRVTTFGLSTYLSGWDHANRPEPCHGPLVQGAFGAPPVIWPGQTVSSSGPSLTRLSFASPHGLVPGQAIVVNNEIRFVKLIPDSLSIVLNAPFSATILAGISASPTANYALAKDLPSVSIYDCWNPTTAVQRVLVGAAVNEVRIRVNGDFHEFEFSGNAADLLDNASFVTGQGNLTQWPQEPANPSPYDLVPGNLGQVWISDLKDPTVNFRCCTLTSAELSLNNDLDLRDREFGCPLSKGISPGIRNVSLQFTIFEQDDPNTQLLYEAARQRNPLSIMLQLGQTAGNLLGVYLPSLIPEVPEFDDSERRLQWQFANCRAQGGDNDEISVAFG